MSATLRTTRRACLRLGANSTHSAHTSSSAAGKSAAPPTRASSPAPAAAPADTVRLAFRDRRPGAVCRDSTAKASRKSAAVGV
ncbi:hypothetical protein [Kitasatospora sp. NPDC001132]